jgi:hypothetical protein
MAVVNTTAPVIGCVLDAENDRGARRVSDAALKTQAPGAEVDHFTVMVCALRKVFDQDCCRVVQSSEPSGFPGGFHFFLLEGWYLPLFTSEIDRLVNRIPPFGRGCQMLQRQGCIGTQAAVFGRDGSAEEKTSRRLGFPASVSRPIGAASARQSGKA